MREASRFVTARWSYKLFCGNIMADNFLERRMEDMRRGVLSHGRAVGPGGKRVLVLCDDAERTEGIVRRLRGEGCRVAFTGTDVGVGTRLAQSSGAQFHPVGACDFEGLERSLSLIWRSWRGVDLILLSVPEGWDAGDYRAAIGALVSAVKGRQPVASEVDTLIENIASAGG